MNTSARELKEALDAVPEEYLDLEVTVHFFIDFDVVAKVGPETWFRMYQSGAIGTVGNFQQFPMRTPEGVEKFGRQDTPVAYVIYAHEGESTAMSVETARAFGEFREQVASGEIPPPEVVRSETPVFRADAELEDEALATFDDHDLALEWGRMNGILYETGTAHVCVSSDQQIMWLLVEPKPGLWAWVTLGSPE